jgi:hypothetical protein
LTRFRNWNAEQGEREKISWVEIRLVRLHPDNRPLRWRPYPAKRGRAALPPVAGGGRPTAIPVEKTWILTLRSVSFLVVVSRYGFSDIAVILHSPDVSV